MRVLLTMPHVFAPRDGSLYSSQTAEKRPRKLAALREATIGNLLRLGQRHWIHASLGLKQSVVTRAQECSLGLDLTIHVITPAGQTLVNDLGELPEQIKRIDPEVADPMQVPMAASKRLLEQSADYDMVAYSEDDLAIEDPELFHKINHLVELSGGDYVFLPHRCEQIPGKGDVILSGDPDGGRPDLFWDTGERAEVNWPLGVRSFYRATNPHSGFYALTQHQAQRALAYWQERQWTPDFVLSGPLEQAGSGLLLPLFKLMKPIPEHYRFLMVRHQDELWKRHRFEQARAPIYETRSTSA
ncbi:hypothetical protein [Synechococcus sp. MIT S1220]|uniref:hypothetical protein n=1 Tax=Synechococcus sp. MIT S1220 TaxID=3082549 RepID=UPI0039AFD28B